MPPLPSLQPSQYLISTPMEICMFTMDLLLQGLGYGLSLSPLHSAAGDVGVLDLDRYHLHLLQVLIDRFEHVDLSIA